MGDFLLLAKRSSSSQSLDSTVAFTLSHQNLHAKALVSGTVWREGVPPDVLLVRDLELVLEAHRALAPALTAGPRR
jgi:hypothetical protein